MPRFRVNVFPNDTCGSRLSFLHNHRLFPLTGPLFSDSIPLLSLVSIQLSILIQYDSVYNNKCGRQENIQ
jgi:hypothetical protein